MTEPPLATSPKFVTKTLKVKYYSYTSPLGIQQTITLYEGDGFREDEYTLRFLMKARPEAPKLQRPLTEVLTLYKINTFTTSLIEATAEVEIDPTKLPSGIIMPD